MVCGGRSVIEDSTIIHIDMDFSHLIVSIIRLLFNGCVIDLDPWRSLALLGLFAAMSALFHIASSIYLMESGEFCF